MSTKKPDAIAWDEENAQYHAKLLPYAASLSGPIIDIPNVEAFKLQGVQKASKHLQAELKEIQDQIKAFVASAQETERIYRAQYKFEPIIGETYFLYEGRSGDFLSIIPPEQWKQKFLGQFRLTSEFRWEKIPTT